MDQQLFSLIHSLAGKSHFFDFLGIFLADYLGYFLILAAIFFVFSLKDWKIKYQSFALILLSLILSRGILTELIRFFYYRPRPFVVLEFSPLIEEINKGAFPSGHAAFYFTLTFSVFWLNKKLGQVLLAGAFLIGLARVFVGVHWPLDILGGALVAAVSVYLVNILLTKTAPRKEI